MYAAVTAHAKGMKVIGLTGAKDSKLETLSDVCIKAPQTETYTYPDYRILLTFFSPSVINNI